jgi:hypothetical protein
MVKIFLVKNHQYFISSNIKINNDSELCLNWWPVSCLETNENLPHPLCKVCANWLPDIEDIVKSSSTIKGSKCINEWSKSS